MAIHGWSPFYIGSKTTSQSWDLGHMVNRIVIKNTDAAITIWIRLSEAPETAAATSGGANASFPLAASESIEFRGTRLRYVNHISASGTPALKGVGYLDKISQGTLRKL
jgi:hypothetical protein